MRTWFLVLAMLFGGCVCETSGTRSQPGNPLRPKSDPSAAIAQASAIVSLPHTDSEGELTFSGAPVFVTKKAVHAGAKQARIFDVPAGSLGFAPELKPGGRTSLHVPKLSGAIQEHRETNGRALLFVDEATDYRILVETIAALDKAGFMFWTLVGQGGKGNNRVVMSSSRAEPTVWVVPSKTGTHVIVPKGNLAAGCAEVGEGVAVAARDDGKQHLDNLRSCLTKLGDVDDAVRDKTVVGIAPEAMTAGELVGVIDAVRASHARIRLGVSGASDTTRSLATYAR